MTITLIRRSHLGFSIVLALGALSACILPKASPEGEGRASISRSTVDPGSDLVNKSQDTFDGGIIAKPKSASKVLRSIQVPMRDGIKLSTDIYFPENAAPPYAVVYEPDYYGKNRTDANRSWRTKLVEALLKDGFVYVIQDVRGRYESGGYNIGLHGNAAEDGHDTIEWLAAQEWSNGNVGTYGCSHNGEYVLHMMKGASPHMKAVVANSGGNAAWGDGFYSLAHEYSGGAWGLGGRIGWYRDYAFKDFPKPPEDYSDAQKRAWWSFFTVYPAPTERTAQEIGDAERVLPVDAIFENMAAPPNDWKELLAHYEDKNHPYWKQWDFVRDGDGAAAPTLLISSWHDHEPRPTLWVKDTFANHSATNDLREAQHAIIHSGHHCGGAEITKDMKVGARDLGDGRFSQTTMLVQWYNHWLREGNVREIEDMPKIQYHTVGTDTWHESDAWPPASVELVELYARPGTNPDKGSLTTAKSDTNVSVSFIYDPDNPTPSVGGPWAREIIQDQSEYLDRDDLVVFKTPPLSSEIVLTGNLDATVFVSSSTPDTDLVVKLSEETASGQSLNIQEGIQRLKFRNSWLETELMQPGQVYEAQVRLQATSIQIPAGSKLVLSIAGSSFPRWDRNLNTGENNFQTSTFQKSTITIHSGPKLETRITLPFASGELTFASN